MVRSPAAHTKGIAYHKKRKKSVLAFGIFAPLQRTVLRILYTILKKKTVKSGK